MTNSSPPLLVANWKMHGSPEQARSFTTSLLEYLQAYSNSCPIVMCPPVTLLGNMHVLTSAGVALGGQNCHHCQQGAYTGEISAAMLQAAGCQFVILGHSERRQQQHESSELIQQKAASAHAHHLTTIICVGETLYERKNHLANDMVLQQIHHSLPATATAHNTIIAYEPVWSIGSDTIPDASDIKTMHGYIKTTIAHLLPDAGDIPVIYGGSVSAKNASEILAIGDVAGLLLGRASLDIDEFSQIITLASH